MPAPVLVAERAPTSTPPVLSRAEPADDWRTHLSPTGSQIASSSPDFAPCQDPAMAGPALVRTGPITSPAPHPPNVSNGCGISVTPAIEPAHVVHRVLKWAPPATPPTAMILSPSLAIDCHLASKAYPLCAIRGTSVLDPSAAIRSSRGFTVREAANPPTSIPGPAAVRVTGSTSGGISTLDQVGVGPGTTGPVSALDTGPRVEVHPLRIIRIRPRLAGTTPRRTQPAGSPGPRNRGALGVLVQDRAAPKPCRTAVPLTRRVSRPNVSPHA